MNTFPGSSLPRRDCRTGPFAAALLLAAIAGAAPARAQDPNLVREIQEIAARIDEQLQEIDRLLLDSGKKSQPREKPKGMLRQSHERSADVEAGIDALIQKLTEMKNQGSQSQSGDQQQDQQQQDPQQSEQQRNRGQRGQQTRRENQTPNFVQQPPRNQQPGQPQEQQGQPQPCESGQPGQQPPPGQGNPLGGQDHQGPGENRTGNRQPEPDLGPGQPGQGEGSWGDLPPYVNFLKNRGSAPTTVPAKYRKYWEAYLKNKPGGPGNGGR